MTLLTFASVHSLHILQHSIFARLYTISISYCCITFIAFALAPSTTCLRFSDHSSYTTIDILLALKSMVDCAVLKLINILLCYSEEPGRSHVCYSWLILGSQSLLRKLAWSLQLLNVRGLLPGAIAFFGLYLQNLLYFAKRYLNKQRRRKG